MTVAAMKQALHRHLWQRLPYRWRRDAMFRATSWAAPRPDAGARPAMPLIVAGTFKTASGLGQSARFCRDALVVRGMHPMSIDLTAAMMQPTDDMAGQATAAPSNAHMGPGTLIVHINAPLMPLAMLRLGREIVRDKYIVGCWAWELPATPAEWKHGVPFVHEIWVPSNFCAAAIRPIAAGRPVRVIPYAVTTGTTPSTESCSAPRPFTVLTMFSIASSFARKNPLAAIEAFRAAFGDDPGAKLIVKTSRAEAFPEGLDLVRRSIGSASNIALDDRVLSRAEIDHLYANADAVLSLHRSEGFGLLVAEAMVHGKPAVTTDWSATTDFFDADCGMPVPYRLVPAHDPQGTYDHPEMQWAEPDVTAAAMALRRLREDPALRRALGETSAKRAREIWSAEAYAQAVARHLGLAAP